MQNLTSKQGWEFFDDLKSQVNPDDPDKEKKIKNIEQLKADYKEVFSGAAWERVAADLKKRYVDPPVLQGYFPDGINTAIKMAERSTEQKIINQLLTINKTGD